MSYLHSRLALITLHSLKDFLILAVFVILSNCPPLGTMEGSFTLPMPDPAALGPLLTPRRSGDASAAAPVLAAPMPQVAPPAGGDAG